MCSEDGAVLSNQQRGLEKPDGAAAGPGAFLLLGFLG